MYGSGGISPTTRTISIFGFESEKVWTMVIRVAIKNLEDSRLIELPLRTNLFYTVLFFGAGNHVRQSAQETLQHNILGRLSFCNVWSGAVLPWKPQIFRLQLQFFSLGAVWN